MNRPHDACSPSPDHLAFRLLTKQISIISPLRFMMAFLLIFAGLADGAFSGERVPTRASRARHELRTDSDERRLEFPFVPDMALTTGSLCHEFDEDFKGYRYAEGIAYCERNVSWELKDAIYEAYDVAPECRGQYTIDHFIPLSIGGTNRPDNLWPEHKSIKALRQQLEQDLYNKVSRGQLARAEAVATVVRAKLNPPVPNPDAFRLCH